MHYAYVISKGRLVRLEPDADPAHAIWIDLIQPGDDEIAMMHRLGVPLPTLADMEEIEISNRLYRDEGLDFMTAVLPGENAGGQRKAMPVSFILDRHRLVTVRHHSPRPFLTYPDRADRSTLGCSTSDRLFLGLVEEIVARQADILEGSGRILDETMSGVFVAQVRTGSERLQAVLQKVGREAETMSQVRLGLMTTERVLAFYSALVEEFREGSKLRPAVKAHLRDVQALEVHADFLSSRVSLAVDSTLGLINLQQNNTVRILSILSALFMPPTLIASMYGMNFDNMPELHVSWGYPLAIVLMVGTAIGTWLLLRWKNWL
ncbi:magnesium transporter CorA family protein [Paracoccus sp. (in: a-proteobacteria)]|uniref:magnesium transporter CorA family protein n=1 Tax=Paracoccus sp. TaxID=267 RepID=UPI003A844285